MREGEGGIIENRLFDIPEEKFVEIVRLLEQVGDHPEVRETIASIRPRLVQVRPARRLTLKRVFCDPFEDLLEAAKLDDVPISRLSRSVIDPVWALVESRGDRKHMGPLEKQVKLVNADDASARHGLGCRLWYVATTTLRDALAEAGRDHKARRALFPGGDEQIAQVRDLVEFLEIGHQIVALKNTLPPKPIPALEPEDIDAIEAAVKDVAKIDASKPYYLLLVVASRLRCPADLLAAMGDMDFGKARREKAQVFAKLSGLVVTSLEDHSARLDGLGAAADDPTTAVCMAEHLVDSLDSTRAVMDSVKDSQYDDRLEAVRLAVRGMVQWNVMAPAGDRILASLPTPAPAGSPPSAPDDEAQIRAEDHARALRRCEGFAGSLGIERGVADTLKSIGAGIETKIERLVDSIDAAPRTAESLDALEMNVFYAVRMMELVAGSAQADALRLMALKALDAAFDDAER